MRFHYSTEGADGYVSLEVSPHLAHDSAASIDEARRLFATVDRPNLMIKISGTVACLPAIEELLWEGINVNITFLFSITRYKAVADTYQRALERRLQAGRSLHEVASVASSFLSRIDILVDELLAQRVAPDGSSPLTPHPNTPWRSPMQSLHTRASLVCSKGSAGSGLNAANGMALANRLDHIDARIY